MIFSMQEKYEFDHSQCLNNSNLKYKKMLPISGSRCSLYGARDTKNMYRSRQDFPLYLYIKKTQCYMDSIL